jgi:hypothetical protein
MKKCSMCDYKADVKVGDLPQYLCAKCWIKVYGKKPVHGTYKEQKK